MPRLVVSQNERLLLHLLEIDRYRDEVDVPLSASQEGIAQELKVQVHNASRALASLEAEGLVFDRLAHVRGAPKRRRAYFLTEKGRQAARSIRSDIAKRKVVLEHEGKVQELPLEDAVRKVALLTGTSPAFCEIMDLARASDSIRPGDLARPSHPSPLVEHVMRAHGRPKVESFFGREAELKRLSEALAGGDVSSVLLWGMPGIGKSTLASKIFDDLVGKRSVFWYSFREWDTEASFMSALAEFLTSCGRGSTSSAARLGSPASELYLPLVSDLSGSDIVMFLDDIHKLAKGQATLISVLVEAARSSKSSKVILISRSVPPFFSRTSAGNLSVELMGLDRDSAWRMAQSLSAKDAGRVVDESHGHPLLLSLMARGVTGQAKGDIVAFIDREVYSTLPEGERNMLELLSVFRHPVRLDAIPDVDYDAVTKLRERALLVEQEDGVWTHDLLRDFFSSRMPPARMRSLHRIAAAYCESHPSVEWKLETLYHYVEASDWDSSRAVSMAHAYELAKEFPEETLALVSRIPRGSSSAREYAELLFVRGQLSESLGRADAALSDFQESLALLDGDSDAAKRALVLETFAKLQSRVEKWSESLAAHKKALRLYEDSGDRDGQTREWLNIGGVHRRNGDFAQARDAYNRALSLAATTEDRSAQAACLNNLGLLDWDEGRLNDAEMRIKESVRLAHATRDHGGEARGLENLADLFKAQLRFGEAANIFLESAEAFRRAGEIAEFKRLQAACASVLGEQGRFADAIELCEKALERPELRKRRGLFQKAPRYDAGDVSLSSTLFDLLRLSGDLKKAQRELARFTSMAEAIGDPSLRGRGLLMQALLHEDAGDLDSARDSLEEAEGVLRTAGNSEGLVAVHMRRGIVEEKRGDDAAAARHYEEASRHAEIMNDKHALAIALENLDSVRKPSV